MRDRKPGRNVSFRVDKKAALLALAAVCLLAYALLFGRYRIEEVDDAWYLSYFYNKYVHGSGEDIAFADTAKANFFMAAQIAINGPLLSYFGWSKAVIHTINLAWMALAAASWWAIGGKVLGGGWKTRLVFVALLFASEAMIGAAYKARSDAMAFALASGAILLYAWDWPFLAGFLLLVGFETHPIALVGAVYLIGLAAHSFVQTRDGRALLRRAVLGGVGALCGVGYYFLLHRVSPAELIAFLRNDAGAGVNPLYSHFFLRAGMRFVPELGVVLLAFVIAVTKRDVFVRRPSFLLFGVVTLSSLLMTRGNFHYAIFYYPALVLLVVDVANTMRWRTFLALGAALYFLAFHGALLYRNRHIDEAELQSSYRALAGKIAPDKLVFGPPNAWFALKEQYRYPTRSRWVESYRGGAYLIVNDANPPPADFLACVSPRQAWRDQGGFRYAGQAIELYEVEFRGCR
jgi:hypothetical protein